MLISAAALAIYKPAGMTAYGARSAFRFALAALVITLLAMALLGQHGPGAH